MGKITQAPELLAKAAFCHVSDRTIFTALISVGHNLNLFGHVCAFCFLLPECSLWAHKDFSVPDAVFLEYCVYRSHPLIILTEGIHE